MRPMVQRNRRLAASFRAARDSWMSLRPAVASSFGFRFSGNDAMAAGQFEPEETKLIVRLLNQVDVLINVGANIGYYCCIAASLKKQILAFEPVASNLVYLLRNIHENGFEPYVEVVPIACSNRTGVIPIFGCGTGASMLEGWAGVDSQNYQLVACGKLDRYCTNLDNKRLMVLIDVEGAEKFVLQGAFGLLQRVPKPIWFVEISSTENQPKGVVINPALRETFQIFFDAGYSAYAATESLRAIEPAEIEAIEKSQKNTLETHNFIFIERGTNLNSLLTPPPHSP